MLQIIYASAATRKMASEDLRDILAKARAFNAARGITGILVYDDGSFLQVLEGPSEAVASLVERIERDPRHTRFRLLSKRETEVREFGEWTMGFADVSVEAAGHEGFTGYGPDLQNLVMAGARARGILEQFCSGGWRQSDGLQEVIRRR